MKKNTVNFNILTFLLFVSALSANAGVGSSPVIIEYNDTYTPSNPSSEARRILDEINIQEKIQFKSDTTKILNQMMNETAKQQVNIPMLKYGAPVGEINKPIITPIAKYAPIMSLYAVPSPNINPINP